MHWLHIKGDLNGDAIINLESVSYLNMRKSESVSVIKGRDSSSCTYYRYWLIEAMVGNCMVIIHKSPEIIVRKGVQADMTKAVSYEHKCANFYRKLTSYLMNESEWELHSIMFAPDYTSIKE